MKKIFSISNLLFSIYFICICFIALFAYRKPHYNWDMLAYMALVVRMQHNDINAIHAITYSNAKENVPEREFSYLLGGQYRKTMAEDPGAFYKQLPNYIVKPLYIGMIYLFNQAGFKLTISTVLPSILSYLLIGLLLFYWLKKYLNPAFCFVTSLLIMYSGFMVSIAGESTPDSLSSFLLLSAFYFIIEKPALKTMCFFMTLAVFTRLDNIITCLAVISFLFYTKKSPVHFSFKQYLLILFILACCYFSITLLLRPFDRNMLFYPEFADHLDLSHGQHGAFSLKDYMALSYSKIITAIVYQHFTLFMLVILFIIGYSPLLKIRVFSFDQLLALLLVLIIGIRFILFPDLSDRFNIAYYICALILLIKKYSGSQLILARA